MCGNDIAYARSGSSAETVWMAFSTMIRFSRSVQYQYYAGAASFYLMGVLVIWIYARSHREGDATSMDDFNSTVSDSVQILE